MMNPLLTAQCRLLQETLRRWSMILKRGRLTHTRDCGTSGGDITLLITWRWPFNPEVICHPLKDSSGWNPLIMCLLRRDAGHPGGVGETDLHRGAKQVRLRHTAGLRTALWQLVTPHLSTALWFYLLIEESCDLLTAFFSISFHSLFFYIWEPNKKVFQSTTEKTWKTSHLYKGVETTRDLILF